MNTRSIIFHLRVLFIPSAPSRFYMKVHCFCFSGPGLLQPGHKGSKKPGAVPGKQQLFSRFSPLFCRKEKGDYTLDGESVNLLLPIRPAAENRAAAPACYSLLMATPM
jgi:hypothetical protein